MATDIVAKTVIKLSHLNSRKISKIVSPQGKKIQLSSGGDNWFSNLLGKAKNLIGFLTSKIIGFLRKINFKKIWQWITQAFQTIWNFNWQATDKELNERIKQTWLAVETRMYGVLGKALGWLVCGAAPGLVTATFNLPLATLLLNKVGDEFVNEMLIDLQGFFLMVAQSTMQWLLLKGYMMIRRIIKGSVGTMNKVWQTILGVSASTIKEWGEKEGENWTFSKAAQEKREKLGERMENNLEEFTEEFSDACIEAGFVVAEGLDEWFGLDGMTKGVFDLFGEHREIKFTPNKDVPSESFLIAGNEEFVKNQVSSILHTTQLIDNREIGLNLPSTGDWDVIPVTENNGIEVMFEFFNYEEPPYWTKERRKTVVRSRLVVPNVNPLKLTWTNIKQTFGTNNVFNKGNTRCEAHLSNGRKLVVYASTDTEGEKMLENLASFTDAKLVYPIDVRTHKGTSKRTGYNLQITPKPQYLSAMTITNWFTLSKFERQKDVALELGKQRKNQAVKLKMHYKTEPSFFNKTVLEATKKTL
ncbi:hypothetical protein VB834_09250 [Limnoraphis robusta Tam1]|uniref:Uncharacterized protein n=1 Tax=Limnoraphis robusta CCNP1315 TaxID=3110306 RepID=A0ABU5TXW8_9CYAN|nr:hypothetical protein [Limnoraphis robusta]MEA5500363.1 hypothetical protein [Limnoraphis robusta BA-68 BA1]MEA5519555.1 hypothetical protein [Limnoraphis robusta CCNP1315]MEA5539219.1 hypothetical protein [Limnoraphis robusta Tam1]MEA5545823.1 hypothetical protein [Limnoraphis robusta CCNP1324]